MQAPLDHIGNIAQPGCDMWMSNEELMASCDVMSGEILGQTRSQMLGIVYTYSGWTVYEDCEINTARKFDFKIDLQRIHGWS